jgi:endonuclease/exonuclease/phosphatase (EEP) superfamily protein YafD
LRSRALFIIGAVAIVKLVSEIGAVHLWFLELPVHFQPQLFVALMVGLVVLALAGRLARSWTRLDSLAVIAAVVTGGVILGQIHRLTPAQRQLVPLALAPNDADLAHVRVLALNVESSNDQYDAVLALVRDENPDLIVVTEVTSQWMAALASLDAAYPHHLALPEDEGNFGIACWSRWPLREAAFDGFGSPTPQFRAIVRMPLVGGGERDIRLVGMHPLPPASPRYTQWRNAALQGIPEWLGQSPHLPLIVAGDLNDTRYAPTFQQFCRDAGVFDAGFKKHWERSWPTADLHAFLAIRIDHVLISDAWRVRSFRIGPFVGSDHYPVIADLQLVRDGE